MAQIELQIDELPPLPFSGERLTLARNAAKMTITDLARATSMSTNTVTSWEAGTSRPTRRGALRKLCAALNVLPEFFLPVGLTSSKNEPFFRSMRNITTLDQDHARAYGRYVGDVFDYLNKVLEFRQADIPTYPVGWDESTSHSPELAAQFVRRQLSLPPGPAPHMIHLVERLGIIVAFALLEENEDEISEKIDAYSMPLEDRAVMVLNPGGDYYRQRFDVAHELGHIVMHADAPSRGRVFENQAHRFASEFLMPASDIVDQLPSVTTKGGWTLLAILKERWLVSQQALLRRSHDLGKMTDVTYKNAMSTITTRRWRMAEPGRQTEVEHTSLLHLAIGELERTGTTRVSMNRAIGMPSEYFDAIVAEVSLGNKHARQDGMLSH